MQAGLAGMQVGLRPFTSLGRGMACITGESAAVLAALAPVLSPWRVPYLNRGGFEGEDVVVGCSVLRRARGGR
jgi:hypothetical protein